MSADPSSRSAKLSSYFISILRGRRQVCTPTGAKKFFEAVCNQEDRAVCVEKLVASSHALDAVKVGLRLDTSARFINGTTAAFLNYLSDPSLKQLCNGQYLQRVLSIIGNTPTLVNEFLALFNRHSLTNESTLSLAWLTHELLILHTQSCIELDIQGIAQQLTDHKAFVESSSHPVRVLGKKIEKHLRMRSSKSLQSGTVTAGGRHDNDFADFREIAILPSGDEMMSKEPAFYRRADAIMDVAPEERPGIHLDNQFRLLREDMLGELRLDLQVARGQTSARRPVLTLARLNLEGVHCGKVGKRKPCALTFRCDAGIPPLASLTTPQERKTFLSQNRNFLKHQSFGCLLQDNEIVAFATLARDDGLLITNPPKIVLKISGRAPLHKALIASNTHGDLHFVLVDTPIFFYEPFLKCLQDKTDFPLAAELLPLGSIRGAPGSPFGLCPVIQAIREHEGRDLRTFMDLPNKVELDPSQTQSPVTGLNQTLSLIQGPLGTGKSFIGALLAKTLYYLTQERILVLSYTNHALDQFLEDLIDIGIPKASMVRLGSRSTPRTEDLKLSNQTGHGRLSTEQWNMTCELGGSLDDHKKQIVKRIHELKSFQVSNRQITEHLEFSATEEHFYDAFSIPYTANDMTTVNERGRGVGQHYLLDRWCHGRDAGVFKTKVHPSHREIWEMDIESRKAYHENWRLAVVKESISVIASMMEAYNNRQNSVEEIWKMRTNNIIEQKRVIGCTTTAAAMSSSELRSAAAGVVIVEEAGEILESHILTAMTEHTKQVILIGDHKQLRPRVKNYNLTVEKGEGYNLNQSLFERLVLGGYRHETLNKQHRMPPEISAFVRQLTYPDLEDSSTALNRPCLRGFQDRVMFVNHEHPELEQVNIADRRDQGAGTSKRNVVEADMVLSCVRYLGQQGYGTDKVVGSHGELESRFRLAMSFKQGL